jgi:hypothetical protein
MDLSNHMIPIAGIIGYVNYPTSLRINSDILYFFSILHNTLLALFSAYTFLSLSQILYEKGIVFKSNYYFQDTAFDNLMFYFYVSKYYEFIDTFLICLKGKKPILLQKYHHIGAVICWHLMYYYKVDIIWSASFLNSFVHTIMYTYYLGTILKISQLKFIKKYITTLQLCQFFALYSNFYFYRPPIETYFNYMIINVFALYGVGVIYLFGNFYYDEYVIKTAKKIKHA